MISVFRWSFDDRRYSGGRRKEVSGAGGHAGSGEETEAPFVSNSLYGNNNMIKPESKVPISTFLAKVAECFGFRTLPVVCTHFSLTSLLLCIIFFTLLPGSCQRLTLTLTNRNTYNPMDRLAASRVRGIYTQHRCLHGNPMEEVCLSDGQQQLPCSLGPGEGLRFNAFPQIRAPSQAWKQEQLRARRKPRRARVEAERQRGKTHKRELLSGCQTSLLLVFLHQSTTQRCY